MNKEDFLKAIMELPKVAANNPISAMNVINVDDLMIAVDRFDKVPDYNDLLKENQELKSQLKGTTHCFDEEEHRELKKQLKDKTEDYRRMKDNFDSKVDVLTRIETQQKEFIKYLQEELNVQIQEESIKCETTNKRYILEEILQKYKEIICDNN